MDFLNSLNEIRKNNHKFGIWEKEQKDKQAQRDALNNSREYTPEEIEKARALGENIINAIDVMDNHSESVAENVEAATQPMIGIAPVLGAVTAGALSAKFVITPAFQKKWQERTEFLNSEAAKKLVEEIKDHYKDSNKSYLSNIREDSLLLEWETNKIDNAALKSKVKNFQKEYSKRVAKYNRRINASMWGTLASAVLTFIGANIYAAQLQVEGSKIARYQARKSLEDPKAFVTYTPEQIAQAKAEIEANPALKKQKKKEKLNQGFFSSIKGLFRDRAEYKRAKLFDTDESKKVQRNLTPQELVQARKDQEVIQRTVKIINNQAEIYSENMEVAAGVLIGGTPILGGLISGALNFLLNRTGAIDKLVENKISKNASEETLQLYKEYKDLTNKKNKNAVEKVNQTAKFAEFTHRFKDEIQNNIIISGNKKVSFFDKIKNSLTIAMANRTTRGWTISGIGAGVTAVAGLILGLKLQKSAARAGRYTAKRELEEDPKNFIGYTQDDYKEVENIKSTKKEQSKAKEVLMFIPNVLKQYFAYNKYRKHEFKEEQLLNEQLRKQEVSEEQLREAKNLQRKIFNTFEKVDDNSQVYSESMEAAIEIAQPFVLYGGFIAALAPMIYYSNLIAKGKKSPAEAIKMASKALDKASSIMKTGMFKKYLKSIEKNMPQAVQSNVVSERPLAHILAGVNLADDSLNSVIQKSLQNIKNSINDLDNVPEEVIKTHIDNIRVLLNKTNGMLDKETIAAINKTIDEFTYKTKEEKIKTLKELFNDENNNQISSMLDNFIPEEIKNTTIKNLAKDKIEAYSNNPKQKLAKLHDKISQMTDDEFANKYQGSIFSLFDKKTALETINHIEKVFDKIPKEELNKVFTAAFEEFNKNPDEFVRLVKEGNISSILKTPELKKALQIAGIRLLSFTIIITYTLESWLAELQLKAGRLGVMKSLEDLEDPRYYANIEPTT